MCIDPENGITTLKIEKYSPIFFFPLLDIWIFPDEYWPSEWLANCVDLYISQP